MELIDREHAEQLIGDFVRSIGLSDTSAEMCAAIAIIKGMPTVDAEPVVHGYWATEGVTPKGYAVCSVCRDVFVDMDWVADGKWRSCPGCRAKMDGRREK